jgi:hypothetical protein
MIAGVLLMAMSLSCAEKSRTQMLTNSWRGLKPGVATRENVVAVLGAPERESKGVTYGKVDGLELLSYDDIVASVFLKAGRVALIVIPARAGSEFPEQMAIWESELGQPSRRLPSSRGKNDRIYVYSDHGLTATVSNQRVTLVEIFPPMSADDYERLLYRKPPVFVK